MQLFQDRAEAGRLLAGKLADIRLDKDSIVLGLARGGVPVALEVARGLDCPMDVFLVRKLGVPGREELAMGAIATGGIRVINEDILRHFSIPQDDVARAAAQEQEVLEDRERAYRGKRGAPDLRGKTVVLVDDGLATGASMKAAVLAVREQEVEKIVVGVPVGEPATCQELKALADIVVCVRKPSPLRSIGAWYREFDPTSDEEVRGCLARITKPKET